MRIQLTDIIEVLKIKNKNLITQKSCVFCVFLCICIQKICVFVCEHYTIHIHITQVFLSRIDWIDLY